MEKINFIKNNTKSIKKNKNKITGVEIKSSINNLINNFSMNKLKKSLSINKFQDNLQSSYKQLILNKKKFSNKNFKSKIKKDKSNDIKKLTNSSIYKVNNKIKNISSPNSNLNDKNILINSNKNLNNNLNKFKNYSKKKSLSKVKNLSEKKLFSTKNNLENKKKYNFFQNQKKNIKNKLKINDNKIKDKKNIPKIKKNNSIGKLNNFITQVKEKDEELDKNIYFSDNNNELQKDKYYMKGLEISYKSQKNDYFSKIFRTHLVQSIHSINIYKNIKNNHKYKTNGEKVKLPDTDKNITLIFDLDETLIHCNENQSDPCDVRVPVKFPTGENIQAGINIRPFAKELLEELSKYYQIVIFTASHKCYANPVIDKLDPSKKIVSKRLYRENCSLLTKGFYVKDLKIIENRNLSKIILVDNAVYSFIKQMDNGIPIIPYYYNKEDRELLDLKKLLLNLKDLKDVRIYLKDYFNWEIIWKNSQRLPILLSLLFK